MLGMAYYAQCWIWGGKLQVSRLSEMRLSLSYQVRIRRLTVSIGGLPYLLWRIWALWDTRVIKFLRISFVVLESTQSERNSGVEVRCSSWLSVLEILPVDTVTG